MAGRPGERRSNADPRRILGGILRRGRVDAGLTQEALAHAAGVDRTYVSMLENGKASPTVETLLRLCREMGIRASDVVSELEL